MAHPVALATLTVLFLWIVYKTIVVLYSPLNAIPNAHFTAPLSRLWILWVKATGKQYSACLAAHRRLGPVIRIGPRELSVGSVEGCVQTVYGGNWEKSSMYSAFTYFG